MTDPLTIDQRMQASVRQMVIRRIALDEASIQAEADRMVHKPFLIPVAVYGVRASPSTPSNPFAIPAWPMLNKTAADVLADCRKRIANMQSLRAAEHWTFQTLPFEALQAAERALMRIVATEGATP